MKVRALIMGPRGSNRRHIIVCLVLTWFWFKKFWVALWRGITGYKYIEEENLT